MNNNDYVFTRYRWGSIMSIICLLVLFNSSVDALMQNNSIYTQDTLLLDSSSTSQSILKTLVDNAVEALEINNTTKTLLNLNIVLQALKESNENSSSIEVTKLLLNDTIQAVNNKDTSRASAYTGLASEQLEAGTTYYSTPSTANANTVASKNFLSYENPVFEIKIKVSG